MTARFNRYHRVNLDPPTLYQCGKCEKRFPEGMTWTVMGREWCARCYLRLMNTHENKPLDAPYETEEGRKAVAKAEAYLKQSGQWTEDKTT